LLWRKELARLKARHYLRRSCALNDGAASLPTGPRGRILALSLICLALGGVYLLVVAPLIELYAKHAAVLENRHMLPPRLQAAADELPDLQARVEQLRAAAGTRKITLDGASDAIAAAIAASGCVT
jgi:type II secretory pathway component PulM